PRSSPLAGRSDRSCESPGLSTRKTICLGFHVRPRQVSSHMSTIVRTWTATATPDGAERYRRYFADTLLPQLNELAGFAGAYLLSRELDADDGSVELTTHTFWQSEAAIRSFAGQDIAASSVEPEARAFLLHFDATATHRNLWIDGRG